MAFEFTLTAEFLVPFFFIFAVIFGVLSVANVFQKRSIDAVIALVLAAFAVMNTDTFIVIQEYMPMAVWFFLALFFLAFIMKLFGLTGEQNPFDRGKATRGMILSAVILFAVLALGWMFLQQSPVDLPVIGGGDNLIFLVGFLTIIAIFWGVLKTEPSLQAPPQPKK